MVETSGNDETLGQEYIGETNVNNEQNSTTSSSNQQRFVTRVLHEKNNQVIGAEVIVYDDDQKKIDSIIVADTTSLEEFQEKWENISKYYILRGDVTLPDDLQERIDSGELTTLQEILANRNGNTQINATTLNDNFTYENFALSDHDHDDKYCVINHQSSTQDYGIATSNMYGHTKIADHLNDSTFQQATALSSKQGYELNKKITDMNNRFTWSGVKTIGSHIKYRVNEDLRLCVCNYNRSNYTGLNNTSRSKELEKAGTIPSYYRPTSRVLTPLYRGDVVLYYNSDGSVSIRTLTKIKSMNIHAQVMWHF